MGEEKIGTSSYGLCEKTPSYFPNDILDKSGIVTFKPNF